MKRNMRRTLGLVLLAVVHVWQGLVTDEAGQHGLLAHVDLLSAVYKPA